MGLLVRNFLVQNKSNSEEGRKKLFCSEKIQIHSHNWLFSLREWRSGDRADGCPPFITIKRSYNRKGLGISHSLFLWSHKHPKTSRWLFLNACLIKSDVFGNEWCNSKKIFRFIKYLKEILLSTKVNK